MIFWKLPKRHRIQIGTVMIAVIIFAVGVVTAALEPTHANTYSKQSTSKYDAIQKYADNKWLIEHNIKVAIQDRMNDPDSYEYVDDKPTGWDDNTGVVTTAVKFIGRNAFGGVVINYAEVTLDKDGSVTNVSLQ